MIFFYLSESHNNKYVSANLQMKRSKLKLKIQCYHWNCKCSTCRDVSLTYFNTSTLWSLAHHQNICRFLKKSPTEIKHYFQNTRHITIMQIQAYVEYVIPAIHNNKWKMHSDVRQPNLLNHDVKPSLNAGSECRQESDTAATSPCSLVCWWASCSLLQTDETLWYAT